MPQGITLSPTLFNFHINQINNLSIHRKLVCYADDKILFVEANCWQNVFSKVQDDLEKRIRLGYV